MKKFDNPMFADLADSEWGRSIWRFLNERDHVVRLVVASELGHAALDGVVLELEQEFGEHLGDDRARRMVGAMIREILAAERWTIEGQNVKLSFGQQFSVATRYHRVAEPRPAGSVATGDRASFLTQVGAHYGVEWWGRHYIEIPCGGATVGVDDLGSGLRRVHVFSNKKALTDRLLRIAPEMEKQTPALARNKHVRFRNDLGQRSHNRRYVGWEWTKPALGTEREQIAMAVQLVEVLRAGWLKSA